MAETIKQAERNLRKTVKKIDKQYPEYEEKTQDLKQEAVIIPPTFKDKTRTYIASFVVKWFFWCIILVVLIVLLYNLLLAVILDTKDYSKLLDISKILPIITTAIGSPLGFVIGYYFKSQEEVDAE